VENKSYTKCLICETKVEVNGYLETYISPYNNQEYKLYECPNCKLQWKRNLKFDVITFFEVLEHQDKPRKFLEMIKDLLKEGGYVAGSVPNRENFFQKDFYEKKNLDFPPHHFLRFSQKSLQRALEIVNFSDIEVYNLDFPKSEIFGYLERKITRDKLKIIKSFLKRKISNNLYSNNILVEDLSTKNKNIFILSLRFLKLLRNLFLLPLAVPYFFKVKGNGLHIYFHGRKK
jgi:SAM-dependent methyltransferase